MTDAHAPGAYDGHGGKSPQWWPSRYGADDELGAGNELTPERAMAALQHPEGGRDHRARAAARAGHPGLPAARVAPAGAGPRPARGDDARSEGPTHVSYFEEHVTQTYQIGCHLDGLGHVGDQRPVLQRHPLRGDLRAHRPAPPRHRAGAAVGGRAALPRHRRHRGHDHARGGLRDHAGAPRGGLREAGRRDRRRRRRAVPHRLVEPVDGRQRRATARSSPGSAGTPRTG